jgi:hypothetical protein
MERGFLRYQIDHAPGKEKLFEPAGIGKIGPYALVVNSASYDEAVGSFYKHSFLQVFKKFHECILNEGQTQNHPVWYIKLYKEKNGLQILRNYQGKSQKGLLRGENAM